MRIVSGIWRNTLAEAQGRRPRSRSCDEREALITQHLRIATAILYVALACELAAVGLL
jgi:hypothetical protein